MDIERLYKIYLEHPQVSTDSRRLPEGCMFFALRGESFNGNLFAASALESGATVAVVDDATVIPANDDRYILVPDVLQTLQALAKYHRQQFHGPVLQITGTNGKTTTKELIAAVLSQQLNVLYTQGNLNNHIGVPLTLLRLHPNEHEIAIIETGANHPGEIDFLTHIVNPDYGLITNVGRAHIEGFGSFEGVKKTKGELYDFLQQKPSAHIFVNASNADLTEMLVQRGIDIQTEKCITYGRDGNGICQGDVIDCNPMLQLWWQAEGQERTSVQTNLIGAYNIDNVLAAVAVGLHFGITAEAICTALSTYAPSLGRSEYRKTQHNELIIDAYNANLTSMQAALDNFSRINHPQKMVILGDMKELGTVSEEAHQQVLEAAIQCGAQTIWLVGEEFGKAAKQKDCPASIRLRTFADVQAVKEAIASQQPTDFLILIKGSNSTRLHQLPETL